MAIEEAGYNVTKSIRIDAEMEKALQKIALYEKAEPGTLMRMWLQDRIQAFHRDPKYKRWLNQLSLIPLKETKRK